MRAGAALAAALVLAPALAHAGPPDPAEGDPRPDPRARRMAAEANLEPTRLREGLALGVGIGPSMQIGLGVANASGSGGSLDLRIGTSASDRLAWFVDLFYTGTPNSNKGADTVDTGGLLAAGAQVFALDNLWLRGGLGLGSLNQSGKALAYGFGAFGGGGIDFLRRGRFAVSGEFSLTTTIYGRGVVSAIVLGLGATWW